MRKILFVLGLFVLAFFGLGYATGPMSMSTIPFVLAAFALGYATACFYWSPEVQEFLKSRK